MTLAFISLDALRLPAQGDPMAYAAPCRADARSHRTGDGVPAKRRPGTVAAAPRELSCRAAAGPGVPLTRTAQRNTAASSR